MPYTVNFTDSENKTPITVFDNTSSTDTSLTFPGRNVTGYGQIIAENFLGLLENFASATEPVNPVEGQLWYDSTNGVLQIWDNTSWKAASGIQKGPSQPDVPTSKIGELWVDTTNQQLRIFTGTRWILVGPSESSVDGLRYGPTVEQISDSDNIDRFILTFYIADIPVIIFSKDSFTPKTIISGFSIIRSGINIADPTTSSEISQFVGGFLPNLYGTASNADALNVPGESQPVEASKFLRSNTTNTTDFGINIRSNSGVTLGVDGTFNISNTTTAAKIYNSAAGSSLDLQTNRNGIPATILRVIDNRIGINKASPDQALDVDGNIGLSGSLIIANNTASTNLSNGSIRTAGGVAISKNLLVGDGIDVTGVMQTNSIQPKTTDLYDSGTSLRRWNTVRAKNIIADTIQGVLSGNISGTANAARGLTDKVTFKLAGDVISQSVVYQGFGGELTFNTDLTANIIADKNEPFPNVSAPNDYVLVYRPSLAASSAVTVTVVSGEFSPGTTYAIASIGTTDFTKIGAASNTVGLGFVATNSGSAAGPLVNGLPTPGTGTATTTVSSQGLVKETRNTFVGDLGVPIGAIIPFAGANAPYGYLLCDGSEVERTKFSDLYDVIGTFYNGTSALVGVGTFRLPDLRGRFALGKDNMDNGGTVPTLSGTNVDAGGGTAGRVPDTKATILGGDAGQSSVTLTLANLPNHRHTLRSARQDYSAVAVTTTIDPDATTGLGPTAPGQAQYLKNSGGVDPEGTTLSTAIGTMNPYLTVNYIIRSGPPAF
jgi:microcystin-dependent protein